ncbi:MAG: ADP-ribosylglycohydrolase family protein [Crocosphaera sp.]|nr:ADP-ribosylglycohydrolase family protein [Crocosphaera sp.]
MSQSLLDSFRGCLLGTTLTKNLKSETKTLLNWEIISQKIIIDLIENETISRETCQLIASQDNQLSSGEFILVILPLILFFHETETLLSEQLEKIEKNTNITQQIIEELLLFRQVMNLILKQQNNFLKNIFNLSQSLEKIERFLDHKTSLTELKGQFRQQTVLDSNYLLLSLYCFARTPDNFKLSILQAFQFNHPLILGITATLSGAYNGYSGIPVPWRLTINQENNHDLHDQQIVQLWAKWVGVDDSSKIIRPLETQVINLVRVNNR